MDKKLHIKATAGRNIKVDTNWYEYGDKLDCYLTPAQFKDYVQGFIDYEIIMDDDNKSKSIDADFKVIKKEEVVKDEQIPRPINSEKRAVNKGPKKVG